ncbi:RDD family protein [Halobacteria archaeon HArc-gm2]|nr:RDD family protein [Halobacteria archaeon HArc-gm2]
MSATIAQRAADATSDRLAAYLIDFALLSAAAFGLWIVSAVISSVLSFGAGMGMNAADPSAIDSGAFLATAAFGFVIRGVLWLAIGAVLIWYFVYYADTGQTFGKRSQDVAVVDEDGGAPSKRQRLIRTALLLLPFPLMALLGLFGFVGFFFAMFLMAVWLAVEAGVMFVSDDGQRIGDRVANTYVVGTDV